MKKSRGIVLALCGLCLAAGFVGCGGGAKNDEPRDYNADIESVAPEYIEMEHFVAEEGTTYYTSPGFSLWMEVNGAFLEIDYFSLDGNKRVYDNLYFYKKDYFYIVTEDYKDLYASLGDASDGEYAEEEKQDGYDVQINVKKAGIYKLIFDVDTLKFDMEYKAEIETPVYYTIKNCTIYSSTTKQWVDMEANSESADEFCLKNFAINANAFIFFTNRVHTSEYKVTMDIACDKKYASYTYPSVVFNVGGNYNIYINAKTYVVRLELCNPDTATYSCVYYDGADFIELTPYETDIPYIFRQRIEVTTKYTTSLPKFHTTKYETYELAVVESEFLLVNEYGCHFKQIGTYDVIVNLKTFEISVELLPE